MPTNDKRRAAKRKPPGADTASVDNSGYGNTPSPGAQAYVYQDGAGKPLYRVRRTATKRFYQERYVGKGKWERGLQGIERVLYSYPAVLDAAVKGGTVWVVEGERDADSLMELGLTATTNSGGAGKWKEELRIALMGAERVNLVWDNDKPDPKTDKCKGQEHALQVEQSLRKYGVPVEMFRARSGKDVTDHLQAGHSVDELVQERPGPPLPVEGQDAPVGARASTQTGSEALPAVYQLAIAKLQAHAATQALAAPRPWTDGREGYEAFCPAHDDRSGKASVSA